MTARRPVPVALSIAGSDSGGGAGIQADLKAFAAAGVHGTTAITAITVQNTVGVTAVESVSPDIVRAQVLAVAEDLGVDAVKIGMLGEVATIEAVAQALDGLPERVPVVHDPVMVAESGARLLPEDAVSALVELILPRATVVTPNLHEARVLAATASGARTPARAAARPDSGALDGEELARAVFALGPGAVIVTGGHRDEAIDLLFDGARLTALPGQRHSGGAAHGSGCTHSSTLAARLALGDSLADAARRAKEVAAAAVRDGLRHLGAGSGPVDVFGLLRRWDA